MLSAGAYLRIPRSSGLSICLLSGGRPRGAPLRRKLTKFLVERITVSRDEGEGGARVEITHRSGPPAIPEAESADGVTYTQELWRTLGRL